ncbi:MAG: LamG-like jellyroll fold domain-containing protein [Chthoniobacterales bacterium]
MTLDSSGNGHDLTGINAGGYGPYYDFPGAVEKSTVTLSFDPQSGTVFSGTAIDTESANWGEHCYTNATGDGNLISNGDGNSGGFTLAIIDGFFSGIMNGRTILQGTIAPDGKWHNIALVNDNGTLMLYVDGALDASSAPGGSSPASGFVTVGAVFNGNTGRYEGFTDGSVDEVRIFTFAQGEFFESDLENYVGAKPASR